MTWLTVIMACAIGMVALGDSKTKNFDKERNEMKKYSKDYCRENLSLRYFDNWKCEDIAYQLQDNWLKDDVEYLMRHGYSFEHAVTELIEDGKMH
jgi:hypothetical protein